MLKEFTKKVINRGKQFYKDKGKYSLIDRSSGSEKMCYILSGYKEYLWDIVFERIAAFVPKDVDVCIVYSGGMGKTTDLEQIAEKYEWSYLATKRNQLCLSQNIVLQIFDQAKYIYKLDEDMFVTKEFFTQTWQTLERVKREGRYAVGLVSCLTPVNGYGYIPLLKKYGKLEEYEKKYGKAFYSGGGENDAVLFNSEFPFFIQNIPELKNIDLLSKRLSQEEFSYSICPTRYNIGAILFERELWEKMGHFDVSLGGCGLGQDEGQMCKHIMERSRVIVIAENCAVGHFGYSIMVNKEWIAYYQTHKEEFEITQ
ncbi:MAG: hypothetical protein HFH41_06695 [Lachnospiraceae bacterium]|nr:hypothetical protein [Lachnospiraceae bacterium]